MLYNQQYKMWLPCVLPSLLTHPTLYVPTFWSTCT